MVDETQSVFEQRNLTQEEKEKFFTRQLVKLIGENLIGFRPRFRHKKRGSDYTVLLTGTLQVEPGVVLKDGDQLKVYIDDAGRSWIRAVDEFNDGRFEKILDPLPQP